MLVLTVVSTNKLIIPNGLRMCTQIIIVIHILYHVEMIQYPPGTHIIKL